MAKFIMLTYAAAAILIAVSSLAIWYATGKSVVKSLADLKEPLLIAFGTRNSYAAMPSLFKSLRDEFSLEPQAIHLIVPLNIVVCRYSMVLVYTLGTVFAAQLYGVPFGFFSFVLALFGAVIAALAGAGSPAVAALSMISIVLGMFGLPSGAAIILILAIITMIDPILTVINVHLACASALFIAKPAAAPKDSANLSAVGTTV
jgi:proton glutamate symport protein